MSCGLRDVVNLESKGRPTVLVHTEAFRESAHRQVEMLGQPGMRRVIVPHPVQDKEAGEIQALARESESRILAGISGCEALRTQATS